MKTVEEWAEQVEIVVDEVGSAHDPSRYVNYEATQTKIAAVIAEAVAAEKERVLSTDQARFHMNASLPGTWEYEALEEAKETAALLEREACAQAIDQLASDWEHAPKEVAFLLVGPAVVDELQRGAAAIRARNNLPTEENTTSECNS